MRSAKRIGPVKAAVAALTAVFLVLAGCGEPATIYQVPGTCVADGQRVLILPFMDTRTFVDSGDPYKTGLGEHARELFADAMRNHPGGANAVILTPPMSAQERSLTNAEVAELGREHGADAVIAGQIFSFTDTRAASIPPRAGMFIRMVSAEDGALLFIGDDYQAASLPGAGGGRDLQARNVSDRLVDGLLAKSAVAVVDRVASSSAFASLAPGGKSRFANRSDDDRETPKADPLPEPPPLPDFDSVFTLPEWDAAQLPEAPPIVSVPDSFYELPTRAPEEEMPVPLPPPDDVALEPEPVPPPASAVAVAESVAEAVSEPETVAERDDAGQWEDLDSLDRSAETAEVREPSETPEVSETPVAGENAAEASESTGAAEPSDALGALEAPVADEGVAEARTGAERDAAFDAAAGPLPAESDEILDASFAARMTGDQLAADLFANDGYLWPDAGAAQMSEEAVAATVEDLPEEAGRFLTESEIAALTVDDGASAELSPASTLEEGEVEPTGVFLGEPFYAEPYEESPASAADVDDGPVFSTPLVAEQPRAYKRADMVELGDDPDAAKIAFAAEVARAPGQADSGAVRVLVLPYHDRENSNNLISRTGGGEVVTSLYGTQLAMDPGLLILWDASGQATHDRLLDKGEAIRMGRMVGADYVVRGQVVEFRRAQSVPSFYSVVISTAVLAAQMFFAEFSGVDVATEVYRVSDGACVMSRRDRAQQKYVVQAEKTVRRLAAGMAAGISKAIRSDNPEIMDPLIDDLVPLTVLTNPK